MLVSSSTLALPIRLSVFMLSAALLSACSGSGSESAGVAETGINSNASTNNEIALPSDTASVSTDNTADTSGDDFVLDDPALLITDDSSAENATNTGGTVSMTASTTLPQVDSARQVTWAFAPQMPGVELELMEFVTMPLADSGRLARWNSMAHTGDRLFVSNEKDGRIFEITGRDSSLWFDVAAAVQTWTGRNLNTGNPFHGGVRSIVGINHLPPSSRHTKIRLTRLFSSVNRLE